MKKTCKCWLGMHTHHNTWEFAASCLSHHLKPWPCVRSGTFCLNNETFHICFPWDWQEKEQGNRYACLREHIKPSYMDWVRFYWPQMFTVLLTSFLHHSSEQLLGTDEHLFFPTTASDKQVVMWSISVLHHPCKRWGSFCQEQPCCLFVRCSYLLDAQKLPLSLPSCLICLDCNRF